MILDTHEKQPADVLDYDIDYSEWLVELDEVATAQAAVAPTGAVAIDSIVVEPTQVKVWLSGGTDGSTYKITVTATTSAGRIKQDEFRLKVKER